MAFVEQAIGCESAGPSQARRFPVIETIIKSGDLGYIFRNYGERIPALKESR